MRKVLSILLAIVFFVSSSGFTIITHHCGGKIHKQSVNLVPEDLICGMEQTKEVKCVDDIVDDDCCQNEHQNFKINENFEITVYDIKIDAPFFIAFVSSYVQLAIENNSYSDFLNYHPPLPDKDIPVLIQSFLI